MLQAVKLKKNYYSECAATQTLNNDSMMFDSICYDRYQYVNLDGRYE